MKRLRHWWWQIRVARWLPPLAHKILKHRIFYESRSRATYSSHRVVEVLVDSWYERAVSQQLKLRANHSHLRLAKNPSFGNTRNFPTHFPTVSLRNLETATTSTKRDIAIMTKINTCMSCPICSSHQAAMLRGTSC